MIICSRCKRKRFLGITDKNDDDLSTYQTCQPCRDKLKEYRRTYTNRKRQKLENLRNQHDDRSKVLLRSTHEHKRKVNKLYTDFEAVLNKVYNHVKINDLDMNFTLRIPEFCIPKPNKQIECGYEEQSNLLEQQVELDENFKSELTKSLETHYVDRIIHVLGICGYNFKFYVSSWKNGKYYATYKCIADKLAMKRFGVSEPSLKIDVEGRNSTEGKESTLKQQVLGWITPLEDSDSFDLNLNVRNEDVGLQLIQTYGYHCQSQLSFIADYTNLELTFKFKHQFHRSELKKPVHENKPAREKKPFSEISKHIDPADFSEKLDILHSKLKH